MFTQMSVLVGVGTDIGVGILFKFGGVDRVLMLGVGDGHWRWCWHWCLCGVERCWVRRGAVRRSAEQSALRRCMQLCACALTRM